MEIYKDLSNPASQEFEKLLNSQLSKIQIEEGKIIEGKINKITEKFVFLFIEGLKSEPVLDINELKTMDILFPGIGEIVGGSQREERLDVLKSRIKDLGIDEKELWWYLDLRKFGTVEHSGFGLGLERLILFATGMSNIRDVIPFPRTPKNAEF